MEKNPLLSIIIPTHRRSAILRECLAHIARQTAKDWLEVIVVSDGPDEGTAAICGQVESGKWKVESGWNIPLRYFEIKKSQQGVARNRGVQEAKGEYVLFIGDDIFLAADACERHLRSHKLLAESFEQNFPPAARGSRLAAVLGHVTWDPALKVTKVMQWLEKNGWQFGYPLIKQCAHDFIPKESQHRFTYTSHISLPTEVVRKHLFLPTDLYGWEDIEWGKRLAEMDVKLFYEPDAKAWHHHLISLEDSLKRMETLGKSAVLMAKKDPEFDRVPRGLKLIAYQILSLLPTMQGRHARAFLRGMREAY